MTAYFYVLAGGAIGALMRFGVQQMMGKPDGHIFPWATFIVNMSGCFAIAAISACALRLKLNKEWILFLNTGILGGFTTFSGFSMEFVELFKNNHLFTALIYLLATNLGGILLYLITYQLLKP